MNPLLEHAVRVLDHQPTRSMEAQPLYRRAVRETGVDMPFARFLEAVERLPDHFAVIPPDPVVGAAGAWDPRQRTLYEAALEAAGMTQPLIVLAERRTGPEDSIERDPTTLSGVNDIDPAQGTGTTDDVLRDAHHALRHLLHTADPEDPLYCAVRGALEELHAVTRVLRS